MKYYVYYDAYGRSRGAVSDEELIDGYNNDPHEFFKAMCVQEQNANTGEAAGHVVTLTFEDEKELNEFLESLGDEIEGFYRCRDESRPYNF